MGNSILAGNVVIASANAGSIAPVGDQRTGWYVTVLGVVRGTGLLNFLMSGSNAAQG